MKLTSTSSSGQNTAGQGTLAINTKAPTGESKSRSSGAGPPHHLNREEKVNTDDKHSLIYSGF
jgi:hypothetical protein